jgi:hypothetical protein
MCPQNHSGDPFGSDIDRDRIDESVLRFLDGREEPVDNLRLVSVAVWNAELDRRDAEPGDLSLSVLHEAIERDRLPALDRRGLVEYDRTGGTVALAATDAETASPSGRPSSE